MKFLVLPTAFSIALLASGSALAGPPAANWAGFYAGAHGGYGSGIADNTGTAGFLGGAQAGYLAQPGDNLVFGAQIDAEWSNISGTQSYQGTFTAFPTNGITTNSFADSLTWGGSVTGRVGYAWDRFMPYALAGVALAWNKSDYSASSVPALNSDYASTDSHLHLGMTAGVGIEAKVSDQLSGFVEARFTNFGSANYTFISGSPGNSTTFGYPLSDTTVRAGFYFSFR